MPAPNWTSIDTGSPVSPAVQRINAHASLAELERIAKDSNVDEVTRHHADVAANSLGHTPTDTRNGRVGTSGDRSTTPGERADEDEEAAAASPRTRTA